MSRPVGDFFEWPDKHVPFEGVGKRRGGGGNDDDPTGCGR
jgi:hypothetical protein